MAIKQPFTYEEFRQVYSKVPRLCVDVVIVREGKILLLERVSHGWEGQWHLPGGTVYYQEKLEDAVARVVEEELGVKVRIVQQLGYIEYLTEEKERGFGYSVSIPFLCEIDDEPQETERGGKIGYFDIVPENAVVEQKYFLRELLPQLQA